MTDQELSNILFEFAKKGNCFTKEVRNVLMEYKDSGGQRNSAKQILEKIKTENSNNETMQDGVDDMLDIVSSYCVPNMRVWK